MSAKWWNNSATSALNEEYEADETEKQKKQLATVVKEAVIQSSTLFNHHIDHIFLYFLETEFVFNQILTGSK